MNPCTKVFLLIGCLLLSLSNGLATAQQNIKRPVQVPAVVKGYESASIFSRVGGYLKSISVDIGDSVKRGQPLAVIDVPELEKRLKQKSSMVMLAEAEVGQAESRVREAKAMLDSHKTGVTEAESMRIQKQAMLQFEETEFERINALSAKGAVQRQLLDSARYKLDAAKAEIQMVDAKVESAKAKLEGGLAAVRRAEADRAAAISKVEVAKADLEYSEQMIDFATIRAPWDGKVTSRMFDPGAFIHNAEDASGAKPILELVKVDRVRVMFSLSSKDIGKLKIGTPVTLGDIDAIPGETFEGKVARYSAELDPDTRMMRVEMDLDNADGKLRPGYFGYATIHF